MTWPYNPHMLDWLKANVFLTQWIGSLAALIAALAGVLGALSAVIAAIYPIFKNDLSNFLADLRIWIAFVTALLVLRFSTSQVATKEALKILAIVGLFYLVALSAQSNLKAQEV